MKKNDEFELVEVDSDNPLFKCTTIQQRFVHLYTTGHYTKAKLAQLLEVKPTTINSWLKNPNVRAAIEDIQMGVHEQVQVELKMLTQKATQKLSQLMDSPIDGVAYQAVKDVLDRTGHKQKTEIKVEKTIRTIEQQMKELIDMTIPDGEFTEVLSDAEAIGDSSNHSTTERE